jgi:hypothetical protein
MAHHGYGMEALCQQGVKIESCTIKGCGMQLTDGVHVRTGLSSKMLAVITMQWRKLYPEATRGETPRERERYMGASHLGRMLDVSGFGPPPSGRAAESIRPGAIIVTSIIVTMPCYRGDHHGVKHQGFYHECRVYL